MEIDSVAVPTPPHNRNPRDDNAIMYAQLEAALSKSKETIV